MVKLFKRRRVGPVRGVGSDNMVRVNDSTRATLRNDGYSTREREFIGANVKHVTINDSSIESKLSLQNLEISD